MEKLHSWSLARSGTAMTISHSCGKLSGCVSVQYDAKIRKVTASMKDGRTFELTGPGSHTQRFKEGHPV